MAACISPSETSVSVSDSTDSVPVANPATRTPRCFEFGSRTRYIVLLLVTLCLSSIWSNILTFNFTVICMGPKNMTRAV
uniref:Uncharacterized protein n=1 Tax=Plectus sambesii TaxID=2011161 RepID=A0A914XTG0_9BILA